jgi:hypothetical protein
MDRVIRAVDRIRSQPGAHVDRNFRQGHDAVLAQIQSRLDKGDEPFVDEFIADGQKDIAQLHTIVAPHHLPDDYVFFLEYCGGLLIETDDYNLLVDGIGPMVEEWYGFIMSDDLVYENGFLSISDLAFKRERVGRHVRCFLDLSGIIHLDSIIGVQYGPSVGYGLLSILRDPRAYPDRWTKLADSFTGWLDLVAATEGKLGFV